MSLLQAYLKSPRTRRALSRRPGEKGFSLIELVVVIAVLAVLIVIALPNFQGVTDDAAASAGKKWLVDAFTECTIARTRGLVSSTTTQHHNTLWPCRYTSIDQRRSLQHNGRNHMSSYNGNNDYFHSRTHRYS